MQAVGNDFIVIECFKGGELDWSTLSKRLCDRHFGVGSDGLIVILPSEIADYRMRMFNPDGTEDMCGNGLRCSIRLFYESQNPDKTYFRIETISGIRDGEITDTGEWIVRVNLGKPILSPEDIPVLLDFSPMIDFPLVAGDRTFNATILSTGTTHTVIFFKDLPDEIFLEYSPRIENNPIFPERTSVIWVTEEDGDELKVRVWERGVGETLSCGTGACAAVVAKVLKNGNRTNYRVTSKGGTLEVDWQDKKDILLSGKVESVFRGNLELR
jgi:diaminopimelate epimerase